MNIGLANFESSTIIREIVVGVKIPYSGIREVPYAIHFSHSKDVVTYSCMHA